MIRVITGTGDVTVLEPYPTQMYCRASSLDELIARAYAIAMKSVGSTDFILAEASHYERRNIAGKTREERNEIIFEGSFFIYKIKELS